MSKVIVELSELCDVITKGTTPSNIGAEFTEKGIKYIRSEMLTSAKYISDEGLLYISEETHKKLKRSQLKPGDILFSMAGVYLGKTAILRECDTPANTNQAVALIRIIDEKCNREYVYYYLNLPEVVKSVNSITGQSAQPNINLKQIGNIQIMLPERSVQDAVVTILSTYDSLIANNQKQIKLLEEAAQRLYKEWFVDLRFPGHETTPIVDGVPEGWEQNTINSIIDLQSGFAFKSADFCDSGKYKIVTIKNVQDGLFEGQNVSRIDDIPARMPAHCRLGDGDILLSLTGNVGRVCVVNGQNYLLNQRVAKIKSDYTAYAYCLFRSSDMFTAMGNLANGAAQQNLSPIKTGQIRILIPPVDLLVRFEVAVSVYMKQMLNLNKQIELLQQARDRLLPKLMSGEIEV